MINRNFVEPANWFFNSPLGFMDMRCRLNLLQLNTETQQQLVNIV